MGVPTLGALAQTFQYFASARLGEPAVEMLRELVEVVPGMIAHEFLEG
jgi:hypothetical protein